MAQLTISMGMMQQTTTVYAAHNQDRHISLTALGQTAAMLSTIKLAVMYVCCAFSAVRCQQTWAQVLSGQVLGPLYVLQDGANTSQLVAGHTVDPFVQDEESVPAAVLVAEGELYRHSFTQRSIRSMYFYRTPSEC